MIAKVQSKADCAKRLIVEASWRLVIRRAASPTDYGSFGPVVEGRYGFRERKISMKHQANFLDSPARSRAAQFDVGRTYLASFESSQTYLLPA